MHREAILETLAELDRWKERRLELDEEIAKVERQIAYYESLLREMKREVSPPRVGDLLGALLGSP